MVGLHYLCNKWRIIMNDEQRKPLLRESKEKYPEELEEFCTELELALHVFFHGRTYRKHNEIVLHRPNKEEYRIVVELKK